MANKADLRRRWVGALSLAAAVGMLIAGETFMRERLKSAGFLLFWVLGILAFTVLAMIVAFLELAVVRHRAREEQRALLESTLTEIIREKEGKPRRKPPPK